MSGRVEIENLSKIFARQDTDRTLQALDQINLTIGEGEFVSLLGASGWKIYPSSYYCRT